MMHRRDALRLFTIGAGGTAVFGAPRTIAAPPSPATVPDLCLAQDTPIWACWIGHATVLLKVGTAWILTDPVLFDAYGPSVFGVTIGPRRHLPPALTIETMPKPDLVLLSHAHLDHVDRPTLEALSERYPDEIDVITACHTADVIDDLAWRSLNEMDWGDRVTVHGIELTGLQVKHNGWRWPGEPCRANGQPQSGRSFNGYHLSYKGIGIVFGGDTAYTEAFASVPGPVDLAIMPIGAYGGCRDMHCTPEEAVEMCRQMGARQILPIHHGTFNQASEPLSEPLQRLAAASRSKGLPSIALAHPGETVSLV